MKKLCLLPGLLLSMTAVAGSAIDVQQMSPNSYQLIYRSTVSVSVKEAQQSLYWPAVKVCAGRVPLYGRYKFNMATRISSRMPGKTQSYLFRQEIICATMR